MDGIFLKVLNLSLTSVWLILAVVVLRFILKKAPKWIHCLLWAIVGIRLLLPFSFESIFSLLPSAEVIPQDVGYMQNPAINSGFSSVDKVINPIISASFTPDVTASVNPLQILLFVASIVWITGVLALILYGAVSYIRLKIRVAPSVLYKDNIYYCDNISTPFIFGIIMPKIYLPSGINEGYIDYVVSHEIAHLKRLDHITKPVGFLLLSVYWFNPLVWLSYYLFCRDIESACDQTVIKNMDATNKKNYLDALVFCSVHKRTVLSCPLAFGELGVKGRVKAVINYKKPTFWVVITAVILSLAVAIAFLTTPKTSGNNISVADGVFVKILSLDNLEIEVNWINDTENQIIFGEEFYIYKQEGNDWKNCRNSKEYAWHTIAYMGKPQSSTAHNYSLYSISLEEDGIYKFESSYFVDGYPEKDYTVSAEFEIKNGELALQNQNPYFNATVLETYENSALVEPFENEQIRKSSNKIIVSTSVISTNPVPKLKKGMQIRVVYNGKVMETYPASLGGVFAIYELDKNGGVIFKATDEVKHIFNPVEICYSNGMYSFVPQVEALPTYEIINDFELYEMEFNGPHNLHGKMTEITLTKEKFDSRFSSDKWEKAEEIRQNNKKAWEIYSPFKSWDTPILYLLLEQKDGAFYLAQGYYNMGSNNPVTSDDSQIRFVYKLKEVETVQEANPKW